VSSPPRRLPPCAPPTPTRSMCLTAEHRDWLCTTLAVLSATPYRLVASNVSANHHNITICRNSNPERCAVPCCRYNEVFLKVPNRSAANESSIQQLFAMATVVCMLRLAMASSSHEQLADLLPCSS
jgi:hypothetical protein